MGGIKKYDNITGLNTGHALYSKIDRFIVFGDTNQCLKNGTTYTTTAAIVEDDLLGKSRHFTANSNVVSPTVPIPFNATVMMIYRHTGANTGGTASDTYMFQLSGGNAFAVFAGSWSSYDYRINRRGNFGTSYNTDYKPYAGVVTEKQKIHAMAVDYFSGTSSLYLNGNAVSVFGGTTNPTFTPSTNPINVTIAPTVGTTGSFLLAGFVVFNTQLTDAEKASVTSDPWELTNGNTPLVATIDKALTPNTLITATLLNYVTAPTTVTVSDARSNSINLPLTSIGSDQHTFTMPALATDAAGKPYVQTGNVNLSFGLRTITSTFNVVSPLTSITLISPVATNAFQSWGTDVPVVGEQLISQGNFDVYGNFTGGDPDATYDCWITRLDGSNHYFTIRQGTASPPTPSISGRYNLLFNPIQDCLDSVII